MLKFRVQRSDPRQLDLQFKLPAQPLQMFLPDQETRDFWHATADDPSEYAARVAKFSRRMSEGG